jgi:uncharacterized protein (TIGR02271 family)
MPRQLYLNHVAQTAARMDKTAANWCRRVGKHMAERLAGKSPRPAAAVSESNPAIKTLSQNHIELLAEMLHVSKERIEKGEVRIRKELITENQIVEVPVTREELVIERCTAEGGSSRLDLLRNQKQIRIPLWEEIVKIEKRPVVNEVVDVSKCQVTEVRKVNEAVQREELRVEPEGHVHIEEHGRKDKAA